MEFAQTFTSKNNEKNATSNNAQCINDQSSHGLSLQRKARVANNTGLPDSLKSGVEFLSGYSLDDVRVHYNSSKPAAVQAYAYTQGTDIHIAPGQERCLPHEAWHVTQQMAGRVSPTTSIGGVAVNDNASLEHEADVMGAKASMLQGNSYAPVSRKAFSSGVRQNKMTSSIVQREGDEDKQVSKEIETFKSKKYKKDDYKIGTNGHFDAEYSPKDHKLTVTLPVFYESSVSTVEQSNYEENIKNKWGGGQHHINFQENRLVKWKNKLENTDVGVNFKHADQSEAYFKIRAVDGTRNIPGTTRKYGSSVGGGIVKLRHNSLDKDHLNVATDGRPTLNPSAHETGHMFGLGDEYLVPGHNEGDHSTHYELVKKAFGEDYADQHAVMHARDSAEDIRANTRSVMRSGDTVQKHHYVTFWDAMVKAIQSDSEYGSTPSPKAPNQHGDWKIE